jgi:hypothetical protein
MRDVSIDLDPIDDCYFITIDNKLNIITLQEIIYRYYKKKYL